MTKKRMIGLTAKAVVLAVLAYGALAPVGVAAVNCAQDQPTCQECCNAAQAACEARHGMYTGGCHWEENYCATGGCFGGD